MSAPPIDPERLRGLLERAVAIYSPPGEEARVAPLFVDALVSAGIQVRVQPVPRAGAPERFNVIASVGPAERPGLMLLGHLDTVALPPGEEHAPRWRGEALEGLGAADMKGGCAAMVEALIAVARAGVPLERGLTLALVVGEEDEGDGAAALLREVSAPLVVIGEPTGLVPCVDHFGYLELALEVRGRRAHAALPEHGANAIDGALAWLAAIRERALDAVISTRSIDGGSELFAVAERCRVVLDVHLPPGAAPEPVERAVEEAAAALTGLELSAEAQRVFWAPGDSAREAEALAPLERALARCGLSTAPKTFPSHSDANLFHGRDAVAVVLGPGRLELAHSRLERVQMDQVVRAAELYAVLIVEACGPSATLE